MGTGNRRVWGEGELQWLLCCFGCLIPEREAVPLIAYCWLSCLKKKWLCYGNSDKLCWCGPLQPEYRLYYKGKATTSPFSVTTYVCFCIWHPLTAGLQNVPWFFTSYNKLECSIWWILFDIRQQPHGRVCWITRRTRGTSVFKHTLWGPEGSSRNGKIISWYKDAHPEEPTLVT